MSPRKAARAAAVAFVGLSAVVGVGAMGVASAAGTVYPPRDGSEPPVSVGAIAPPAHDPARPTAVVVLGPDGANAADVLAPYEVLAETQAFNLYLIAPERRPSPLTGGLDVVPDLDFAQLDTRLSTPPDVIIVPELPGAGEPSTAAVEQWLRRQRAEGDPLLVSVCVGAEVLASAGLLDGRPATSHWLGLIGLRRYYPEVQWQDGVRFVDDGDLITTAGVLSGVDGALRVVERMVGSKAAERAARAISWPDYTPGQAAVIARSRPAPADAVAVLSAAYRWDRPTTGVLLTDGVGETELASAFRPYTTLSYLARPVPVTVDGRPITSRHGLTFAPRAALAPSPPTSTGSWCPVLAQRTPPSGPSPARACAQSTCTASPASPSTAHCATSPGLRTRRPRGGSRRASSTPRPGCSWPGSPGPGPSRSAPS